ncbi:MAG: nucleoside deaminase [Dongiaceae bacterium]
MPMGLAGDIDRQMMRKAFAEAEAGYGEGGVPVGAVIAMGEALLAAGHNRRVQAGDPTAHGEIDCLRALGYRRSFRGVTLYTTLSPCMMCTGAILRFAVPRVVIGEAINFPGNIDFLRSQGVEVILLNDPDCIALMARFIREHPELWNEDIAED